MPAKILAFDPNRRIPPRHYTPIAMRGRLLVMPLRAEAVRATEGSSKETPPRSIIDNRLPTGVPMGIENVCQNRDRRL
jgi:hypothetical protein